MFIKQNYKITAGFPSDKKGRCRWRARVVDNWGNLMQIHENYKYFSNRELAKKDFLCYKHDIVELAKKMVS
jgi:hypothetical protein